MADTISETDKRVIHTGFADFVEIQPQVFASTRFDQRLLTVPGEVSRTGDALPLHVDPNTVFLTQADGQNLGNYRTLNPGANETAMLNNLSLVASFARASGQNFEPNTINAGTATPVQATDVAARALRMSAYAPSPFALESNPDRGGFVSTGYLVTDDRLNSASMVSIEGTLRKMDNPTLVALMAGVPSIDRLNVPQAYIESFGNFVVGHELNHLQDDVKSHDGNTLWQTMLSEIEGDHKTLRASFNKDYHDFVMDLRSLSSLNNISKAGFDYAGDPHATQIWDEEYDSGLRPTEQQANEILSAPRAINDRLVEVAEDSLDEVQGDPNKYFLDNPEARLVYLRTMRQAGSFDDIPFGNEFVDKYIRAGERRYDTDTVRAETLKLADAQIKSILYDNTDMSRDEISEKMQDPVYEYGVYSAFRQNGALNNIPGANEAIDHYLSISRTAQPGIEKDPKMLEVQTSTTQTLNEIERESEVPASAPAASPKASAPAPAL